MTSRGCAKIPVASLSTDRATFEVHSVLHIPQSDYFRFTSLTLMTSLSSFGVQSLFPGGNLTTPAGGFLNLLPYLPWSFQSRGKEQRRPGTAVGIAHTIADDADPAHKPFPPVHLQPSSVGHGDECWMPIDWSSPEHMHARGDTSVDLGRCIIASGEYCMYIPPQAVCANRVRWLRSPGSIIRQLMISYEFRSIPLGIARSRFLCRLLPDLAIHIMPPGCSVSQISDGLYAPSTLLCAPFRLCIALCSVLTRSPFLATIRDRNAPSGRRQAFPHMRWPRRVLRHTPTAQPRPGRDQGTALAPLEGPVLAAHLPGTRSPRPAHLRGPACPAPARRGVLDVRKHSVRLCDDGGADRRDAAPGGHAGVGGRAGTGWAARWVAPGYPVLRDIDERLGRKVEHPRVGARYDVSEGSAVSRANDVVQYGLRRRRTRSTSGWSA